jgi:hypothetical protein
MGATALFSNLSRCGEGMKMQRQEENEQQHSRANKAPQIAGIHHAPNKHVLEPSQTIFACQEIQGCTT